MKRSFLFFALGLISTAILAQPEDADMKEKKEKMDAMKAAYITTSLDLSSKEAQEFWPVYNEREEKVHALRMETRKKMSELRKNGKKIEDLSDDELKAIMKSQLDNDEKIAQINKSYHDKFMAILGVKKTAKLYLAEKEFLREIMKQRPPRGGHGGPEPDDRP